MWNNLKNIAITHYTDVLRINSEILPKISNNIQNTEYFALGTRNLCNEVTNYMHM